MGDFFKVCLTILLVVAILFVCVCLCIGYIGLRGTYVCESNPDSMMSFGPFKRFSTEFDETSGNSWEWVDSHKKYSINIREHFETVTYDFYQTDNYKVIYLNNVKYVRKTLNYVTAITKKVKVKFVYGDNQSREYKIKMGQTFATLPPIENYKDAKWYTQNDKNDPDRKLMTKATRIWNDVTVYAGA